MKQKLKGSILAYSLIVLAMMMAIATSLSIATIIEKKGASGTEFSMQSLQTADSGVQLALKKINGNLTKNVINIYGGCAAGVVKNLGDAGQGTYDLYFYADDGVTPADCAQPANKIASIKSVGTYKNTVRSVNVAVAAVGGLTRTWHNATGSRAKNSWYTNAGAQEMEVSVSVTRDPSNCLAAGFEVKNGATTYATMDYTNVTGSIVGTTTTVPAGWQYRLYINPSCAAQSINTWYELY